MLYKRMLDREKDRALLTRLGLIQDAQDQSP